MRGGCLLKTGTWQFLTLKAPTMTLQKFVNYPLKCSNQTGCSLLFLGLCTPGSCDFFFCLFRVTPAAYGSSQARNQIGAVAASLHHSNARSEPSLQPTPQLTAMPDQFNHWARPGTKARDQSSVLMDTRQVPYHWATTGTPQESVILSPPVVPVLGTAAACDVSSLMDLRVVNLYFIQLFSCCEDRSDDFQALHVSDQKPEITSFI